MNQVADNRAMMFGMGLGAFKPINPSTGYFFRDPESVYVGMLVDFGLVGLLLYCGLLVAFWKSIAKDPDKLRRSLLRGVFLAHVGMDFTGAIWRHSFITWYVAYVFYLFIVSRGSARAVSRAVASICSKPIQQPVPERWAI
jgi:O-antigen ligase